MKRVFLALLLNEPYIAPENGWPEDDGPVTVPDGHLFVLGDNRSNSLDSRVASFGMLPVDRGISRVTKFDKTAATSAP